MLKRNVNLLHLTKCNKFAAVTLMTCRLEFDMKFVGRELGGGGGGVLHKIVSNFCHWFRSV